MRGLLADAHLQGRYINTIRRLLDQLDLSTIFKEMNILIVTFSDLGIAQDIADRPLWRLCQADGWVLFTENRNAHNPDSLEATLTDSWQIGCLPVLTISKKRSLDLVPDYSERVAKDLADFLFGIAHGEYCDQPRIYVPRSTESSVHP